MCIRDSPDIISQIPNIIQSISNISGPNSAEENIRIFDNSVENQLSTLPEFTINKSDSLTDVLLKLFTSNWSNNPKKLNEIREILQLYGLMYPKQTVAVTLLRMAKSGRLRRFKSNTGEYVYTASNSLLSSTEKLSNSSY